MCDDTESLVFDLGSGACKFGFAGDDEPRVLFSPVVGRSRYPANTSTSNRKARCIGNEAQRKGILHLECAIERGIVTDWDGMEDILAHSFSELGVSSTDRPVLLTEPFLVPKRQREKLAEILFESHGVPAMHFKNQAGLAFFSSGRHAPIVLECGHGVTQIAAIEGLYVIPGSMFRFNLAGSELTDYLSTLLRESGLDLNSITDRETVRDIKEKHCYVALNSDATTFVNYVLPDGRSISIGNERFRCAEIFFQPSLIGLEAPGVHEMLFNAINKCDVDLRRTYFNNVILSGCSTLLPGFSERVESEIAAMVKCHRNVRVKTVPLESNSAWIGGSAVASLSSFQKMWISKTDIDETGVAAVHRDAF